MRRGEIRTFLFGTLRGRLIIGVALVHAVMMTLFIIDLTGRQRAMLLEHQIEEATTLADSLATSSAVWIASNDVAGLQELVDSERNYPELVFATLTDKEGRILAHTDKSRLGQFLLDLSTSSREAVLQKTPALVDVLAPVQLSGRQVGWARVGLSQKAAGKKLAEITGRGALYALAAIIIGSLIAWRMGRRITQRLYAVQKTIRTVKSGDRTARCPIAGTDEAAAIAGEFNILLDTLDAQEDALAKGEIKYRLLLRNIRTAVVVHGPDTRILLANPMAQELLGLSEEQLLGKEAIDPAWHFLREDGSTLPLSDYPVTKTLADRRPIKDLIAGVHHAEGQAITWVLVNTELTRDAQGQIREVIVTFVDITGRKRAEEERQAHLRFIECLDQVNRAIQGANDLKQLMTDVLEVVLTIFAGDRAWLFYPCDPEAPSFRVPMEVAKPEYPGAGMINVDLPMPPDMAGNLREALEASGPVTYRVGTDRPINQVTAEQFGVQSQMMTALYPKLGKPWVFGLHQCSHPRVWTPEEERLFQEIGWRLADGLTSMIAKADLQKSEAQYRRLVDTSNEGIWALDAEGRTTFVNARMAEMLGCSGEEMLGRTLPDFMDPADVPDHQIRMANRRRGLAEHYERCFRRRDGQSVWTLVSAVPILDGGGNFTGSFAMFADITERKHAEEVLAEQEHHTQSLLRLSRRLERAQTYDQALNAARDEVNTVIGYKNLWVYLLSEDKQFAKVLMAGGPVGETVLMTANVATLTIRGDRMLEEIAAEKEIVVVEDARTDPRTNKEIVAKLGNRTIVNVPICLLDKHLGSVGTGTFGDEGVRVPTPSEREYLLALASHLAVTLDWIRLLAQRQQAEAELRRLNEELEKRVRERTTELERRNYELEQMNKAFVGRELRMVELKARIKELEKSCAG